MQLTFNKVNNIYVAEFEATSDFNVHIERITHGMLAFYQRTTTSGEYAEITDLKQLIRDKVFDTDFAAFVYPKYIKVVSGVEVTTATVTFKE